MTQGFDEWYLKEFDSSGVTFHSKIKMEISYKAGAASRQAEIDELQKRINEALDMLEGRKGKVLFDDIVDTLKGDSNGSI